MMAPPPKWAQIAAYAIPVCVLPSALWRLGFVIDAAIGPPQGCDPQTLGGFAYIASLSIVSLALAYLSVGLVRGWGQIFPKALPIIGGRDVPARGVVIIAFAGATVIGLLTVLFLYRMAFGYDPGELPTGCSQPGGDVLVYYAPLLAWSPLLFLVANDYRRREIERVRRSPPHREQHRPAARRR
jgi:hypothetical protein